MGFPLEDILPTLLEVAKSHPWLAVPLTCGSVLAYKSPELLREIFLFATQRRRDKQEHARHKQTLEIELTKYTNEQKRLQGLENHDANVDNAGNHGRGSNLVVTASDPIVISKP